MCFAAIPSSNRFDKAPGGSVQPGDHDQPLDLAVAIGVEEGFVIAERDAAIGIAARPKHEPMGEETDAAKRIAVDRHQPQRRDTMEQLLRAASDHKCRAASGRAFFRGHSADRRRHRQGPNVPRGGGRPADKPCGSRCYRRRCIDRRARRRRMRTRALDDPVFGLRIGKRLPVRVVDAAEELVEERIVIGGGVGGGERLRPFSSAAAAPGGPRRGRDFRPPELQDQSGAAPAGAHWRLYATTAAAARWRQDPDRPVIGRTLSFAGVIILRRTVRLRRPECVRSGIAARPAAAESRRTASASRRLVRGDTASGSAPKVGARARSGQRIRALLSAKRSDR